jgi:hypothetical protein
MIRTLSAAALLALAVSTGALASGAVVTPATMCNESQLAQAALAVDGIRNLDDRAEAKAELNLAVRLLQDNQPQACMQHLTIASSFVTPNE